MEDSVPALHVDVPLPIEDSEPVLPENVPSPVMDPVTVPVLPSKRKQKCGTCNGCLAVNCTQCKFCLDMKKYGGPGKLKMACQDKVCFLKSPPKRKRKNPVVTEHIAAIVSEHIYIY